MVLRGILGSMVGLVLLEDGLTFAPFSVRFEVLGTEMGMDMWYISLLWSWLLSILFVLGLRGSLILWI